MSETTRSVWLVAAPAALLLLLAVPQVSAAAASAEVEETQPPKNAAASETEPLRLRPCVVEGVSAQCATYEVFEHRGARQGRRIPLNVVVVPAVAAEPLPDPLVLLVGGPGSASTTEITGIDSAFGGIHQDRDILMVDYRGTGGSNSLRCPHQTATPDVSQIQRQLDAEHRVEDIRRCREALTAKADLRHYTTANVVDDLDEVRTALGYNQVNLWGFSYGSRVALVYLRRHPEAIRSVFIAGVVPTDMRGPLPFAFDAQASLDKVFDACASDDACAAAFPDLRGKFDKFLQRLRQGPVRAQLEAPNGESHELELPHDAVVRVLRSRLYAASRSFALPALIDELSRGKFDRLAQLAWGSAAFGLDSLSLGYYLSIYCSEDVPFIDPKEIGKAAAGSFFGEGRIREQMEACRHWPSVAVEKSFLNPVRSDLPVLMVSGAWDPASAPRHAVRAARHLSRSRHVILPWSGHGPVGLTGGFECFDGLLEKFVRAGNHENLDTSCIDDIRPPTFTTPELDDGIEK